MFLNARAKNRNVLVKFRGPAVKNTAFVFSNSLASGAIDTVADEADKDSATIVVFFKDVEHGALFPIMVVIHVEFNIFVIDICPFASPFIVLFRVGLKRRKFY